MKKRRQTVNEGRKWGQGYEEGKQVERLAGTVCGWKRNREDEMRVTTAHLP